jgi:hypothetical protein
VHKRVVDEREDMPDVQAGNHNKDPVDEETGSAVEPGVISENPKRRVNIKCQQ